jgi:hypothetical protein
MINKVEERGFIYLLEKRLLNNWVVFAKWTIWYYLRKIQSLEVVGNKVKGDDDLTKIEGKREEVDNSKKEIMVRPCCKDFHSWGL